MVLVLQNQVGLPFNMFVAGGHPSIENGKSMACIITIFYQ